jgi:hypothetical protein
MRPQAGLVDQQDQDGRVRQAAQDPGRHRRHVEWMTQERPPGCFRPYAISVPPIAPNALTMHELQRSGHG